MIAAGIGFRRDAPLASVLEVFLAASHRTPPVQVLASTEAKIATPQMRDLAAHLNLPLRAVDVAGLDTPTKSARIEGLMGTGSLAEAAALAAAGPGARIIVPRMISTDGTATAAIAEGPSP